MIINLLKYEITPRLKEGYENALQNTGRDLNERIRCIQRFAIAALIGYFVPSRLARTAGGLVALPFLAVPLIAATVALGVLYVGYQPAQVRIDIPQRLVDLFRLRLQRIEFDVQPLDDFGRIQVPGDRLYPTRAVMGGLYGGTLVALWTYNRGWLALPKIYLSSIVTAPLNLALMVLSPITFTVSMFATPDGPLRHWFKVPLMVQSIARKNQAGLWLVLTSPVMGLMTYQFFCKKVYPPRPREGDA